MYRVLPPVLALILLPALSACADPPTAPESAALDPAGMAVDGSVGVLFNPQPEPPAQVLAFQVSGDLLTRMSGLLGVASLSIRALETHRRGSVFEVRQTWEVHPPDPIEPFEIQLAGTINAANGSVELNGSTTDDVRAHVLGTADFSDTGISIGGELMFNPQPEPPAHYQMPVSAARAGGHEDLALARSGTAPFQRLSVAEAAGYAQVSPCIAAPPGAMGFHFARGDLYGDGAVRPDEPEVLLYAPTPNGGMRLVGVEYQVFASAWDPANSEPPSLFGQTFEDHRAEGTTHGLPPHYELHAWIWRHNPAGMFAPFNPKVSC